MNYRDLIVTLVVFGSIPYAFRRPFIGLVVFSWLAYMRVQDLCWGPARTMRFSYFIAVAMFSGFVIFERKKFITPDVRVYMMLLLGVLVSISVFATRYQVSPYVIQYYLEFLKIIAVSIFTVAVVDSSEKLRILIWTIALSLGFFGVKSGLWGILTGGGSQILRGPGGMLGDNNDFSLALTMNLPFLFYLGLSEKNIWVRRGLIAAMGLSCLTVLLTHSRGGFLAMSVTLALMTWRSRNRFIGFGLAGVAAILFIFFAPAGVKERLSSIKKYDEDSSAQARLHTWGIALKMIGANPLFGVGFRNFQAAYPVYDPQPLRQKGTEVIFVAHNSYLQLSAESGVPALATYLLLFGSSLYALRRIRNTALARYETGWILNYVRMFEASLVGFLVGAIFLNRGHFDFAYHIISIVIAFGIVASREMEQQNKYPMRAGTGRARISDAVQFGGQRAARTEDANLGATSVGRSGGFVMSGTTTLPPAPATGGVSSSPRPGGFRKFDDARNPATGSLAGRWFRGDTSRRGAATPHSLDSNNNDQGHPTCRTSDP